MKHPHHAPSHPVAAFTATVLLALMASAMTLLPDDAVLLSDSLLNLPAKLLRLVLP